MIENINTEIIDNTIKFNITGDNNQKIYQEIKGIMSNLNTFNDKENIIIKGKENFLYQITTTESERHTLNRNNNSNPLSKIDLGECENSLKTYYHIDQNISLIILKFEKIANNSLERTLQYEVYDPINKTKLDLSICENIQINIYTPIEISEELLNLYNQLKDMGYDLFNIDNAFYKDICVPFTTPEGTDINLDDRRNYYFNNNEILCQPNCKFSSYSVETKLLKCECDLTNTDIETKVIKKELTKNTAYESFYDTLRFSNYKVLWCYKLAFHINSVTINKGSIIAIIYFLIYLLFLILYSREGIKNLKLEYARIMFGNKRKSIDNEIKDDDNKISEKQMNIMLSPEKNGRNFRRRTTCNTLNKYDTKISDNFPPKKKSSLKNVNYYNKSSSKYVRKKVSIKEKKLSDKKLFISNKLTSENILETYEDNNENKTNKQLGDHKSEINEEEELDNYELNNLEFEEALKLDKRSFISTYWSTIRREHLILFTFFVRNDYNLVFVKYTRFIFLICTDMAVNVFFFSDETMHKMYLDYGKYNFIQQIPQIIISTVVSQILEVFLCFLSMTDKHFYEIKELKYENRYEVFKIIKYIKIKITFYFIFTFLLFAFYWYAIACFCAVYPNTQMAFITDSISSFILGLLYPFVLYLFPTTFRIISLRAKKSNLSCLYWLSDIIPFF